MPKKKEKVREGFVYKCPINVFYTEMENLSTKAMLKAGYTPLSVILRTHLNSMYGMTKGKTTTLTDEFPIPPELVDGKKSPSILKVHNKNAWGFDRISFPLPETETSLEDLSEWISSELKKYVNTLKKQIKTVFGFSIPKKSKIQHFGVYVCEIIVRHNESGKILRWKRGYIHSKRKSDGKSIALLLYAIDSKTMKTGLLSEDLWTYGKDFTTPEDDSCLMGQKKGMTIENICGDEATFV